MTIMDLIGCLSGAILGIMLAIFVVFGVYPWLAHVHVHGDMDGFVLIFLFPIVALPMAVVCGIMGAMLVEYINRKSKGK